MKKYHLVSYFFADLASLKGKKLRTFFPVKKEVWCIRNFTNENKDFFKPSNKIIIKLNNQQLSCIVLDLAYLSSGSHYKITF